MKPIRVVTGTIVILLAVVWHGTANAEKQGDVDSRFVSVAASAGMLEVKAGQMAVDQGAGDEIKKFGQKMIDDHGRAKEELQALAGQKGWTMPSQLLPEHQQALDQLSRTTGTDFDREFKKLMVESHKEAV